MFVWILESLIHIRYMAPIKTLKGCSSDDYKEGICGNYQGLLFTKNGTRQKIFFRSSEERETYYKKHMKGNKEFSKFMRYSVCSKTTPTKKQRRCGNKRNTRKK